MKLKMICLALLVLCATATSAQAATPNGAVFYVVTNGHLDGYQIGTWTHVTSTSLPFNANVRGVAFDVARQSLYVAYGGHGGASGNGSLLRYNVVTQKTIWNLHFGHGVDEPAVCSGKIYLPSGAATKNRTWYVLGADTGAQTGTLSGGYGPHNTICHGGHVYMGGEKDPGYLYATGFPKMGPAPTSGVRPFTVNANDTRAYITWTKFRGFSVADTSTGHILKTTSFGKVTTSTTSDGLSHGISLNPAGTEVYVIDLPAQTVRIYGSGDTSPHLADVKLNHLISGNEGLCTSGCAREGWLLHSLSGRYVFVGDSGDIIDTQSRTITAYLSTLSDSKHGFLEVDWSGGVPVATSTHFGVGH